MARLATLFTVSLRLASVARVAAECVGGKGCDATMGEDGSLLMVHSVVGKSDDVGSSNQEQQWPQGKAFSAERGGLKMNRGGEMKSTAFKHASLLCLKFAVPRSLSEAAANGGLLGEPRQGGFSVHEGEHILVTVAHFPEAPMGWTGAPGASDPVNLPHSLFSVQVPIHDGPQELGQTAYALTDEDTMMNVYRMGENIPAKMASFKMSGGSSPAKATAIRLDRRGVKVFEVEGISSGKRVGHHEVNDFFQATTREWPTGSLFGNFPLSYMQRSVRASKIRKVRKVDIDKVFVTNHGDERLDALLGAKATLVSAYRVEADLEISSQMESVAETSDTYSVAKRAPLVDTWRRSGRQLTHLKKDTSNRLAYQDGDICWATFKMNRDGLAPYLPPGVTLDHGDALVWLTRWQPADFNNPWQMKGAVGVLFEYNELWVEVPVVIEGKKYMFPLTLLLDEDIGTIGGRDTGFPKKMADITYDLPKIKEDGEVTIDISRKGKKVFKMTARLGKEASSYAPITGLSDNSWGAPPMAFMTVTSYSHDPKLWRPSWLIWKSYNKVKLQHSLKHVKVEFGNDDTAPLGRWFTGSATGAGFVRMDQDWTSPMGGVQHQPLPLEGYQTWWNKNYQLLYM